LLLFQKILPSLVDGLGSNRLVGVRSILANPMLNGETNRLDGAMRMAPR
jgi:hypothetical protein